MTRRRKTDGERIAEPEQVSDKWTPVDFYPHELAERIDRIIRRRMAEAWEEGWFDRDCHEADWNENPYRGRRKK